MLKMKLRLGVLPVVMAILLTACAAPAAPTDVLTQTIPSPDRIPVTVLVKNAFSINTFEREAEKKFPTLDLIQVGNYSCDMGIAEYAARLEHNDLTDIVMTWPLEVGEEYWQDCLLDLSALSLTSNYATSMLNNIARDGKLYYLPGPSQVRAIVYNKTLFEENGWAVPNSFDEFVSLCQTIEKSGIRSLQLGFGNAEVLDTALVGYGYEGSYSTPENAQFLADYNKGKGSFGTNFTPALETFQTMIDAGIFKPTDLNITYADREYMLFSRECAMVEDSTLMARMGVSKGGCTDEFALMPFFSPATTNDDWARLYPVCYIGLNKRLAQPENDKKYKLIMQLLEYISTPEGQITLAGDTGAMFSSLKGVPPPEIPEIKDLLPALSNGRYAVFPTLKNAEGALHQGLAGMLAGTMTIPEVIALVDKENANPPIPAIPVVLGRAKEDFTLMETGNFLTDAMRASSGCDFALFLDNGKDGKTNGKGVTARIYKGELTYLDLKRILPDLRKEEKGELWKITMTGSDLLQTLEYAIPVDHGITGWFYYFSGLKMTFAPSAMPGSRIRSITDLHGNKIDPDKLYSIAVMDETVPAAFIKTCEKTGVLIYDIFEHALQGGAISQSRDGRFTLCAP